jgi:processive 1,2-diacylglycerol beta-glucosyltransferase
MVPPSRVLVISASIGSGHVAAARALEASLAETGIEARHIDLLDYTTAPFRRLYRQAYFDLVRNAPDLVDWVGKRLDRRPREQRTLQARLRARLARLVSYHLPRQISQFAPRLLVHTHFLGLDILSTRRRDLVVPQVEVMTDFWVHSLYMQPLVKRYYVGNEDVAVHLRASGVEAARIRVTGIPIDARFASLPDKATARARLDLPPDRDVLLMMLGGVDGRTAAPLIDQLKAMRWPLSVVVVCGRSAGLADRIRTQVGDHDPDALAKFRVLGFTDDVPTYMAAADLMAGKPGGLTTSEALAAGLPFAIVNPYPLQEESNANYLLEYGAGMRIDPLTTFAFKAQRFFSEPERRARMAAAAADLGRPSAARDVVADLREAGWA